MAKKEFYEFNQAKMPGEFNQNREISSNSEFRENSERFYHADEFNQKADSRLGRFKVKIKMKNATPTPLSSAASAFLTPLVIAVTVSAVIITSVVTKEVHKHIISDWITDVAPTCLQQGHRYRECLDCGKILEEEIIPLSEHRFSENYVVVKEPTCQDEGLEVIRCEVCGLEKESRTIARLDHEASQIIVDAAPSCTQSGHQHTECIYCGILLSEEDLPAQGHKYGSWSVTKEATCLAAGKRERVCSVCGKRESQNIARIRHYFVLNNDEYYREDLDKFMYCIHCLKDPGELGFLLTEGENGYDVLNSDESLYQRIPY